MKKVLIILAAVCVALCCASRDRGGDVTDGKIPQDSTQQQGEMTGSSTDVTNDSTDISGENTTESSTQDYPENTTQEIGEDTSEQPSESEADNGGVDLPIIPF